MPCTPRLPADFPRNVFINCPFDEHYTPLFNAIVFAVQDIGFRPRCALEASDAGQFRLSKIMDIISECKYSIHDLSRTELDTTSGLPPLQYAIGTRARPGLSEIWQKAPPRESLPHPKSNHTTLVHFTWCNRPARHSERSEESSCRDPSRRSG